MSAGSGTPRPPTWIRPAVHMATGLAALLLGLLPAPWPILCALGGVVLGWVVFPLTGLDRVLRREGEGWLGGLRTYPLAVLGLVVLLPGAEAAAAWGVLAFGDGLAALVGSSVPAPRLLGHSKATWSGSGAYVVGGALAAFGLSQGVAALDASLGWAQIGPVPGLAACVLAAVATALIDLVPIPPDDNMPAAAAAGGVIHLLGYLS